MPNWGAEIPVTIVDRKPDFIGDGDVCNVAVGDRGDWCGERLQFRACQWNWHPGITAIKLLADHPYYTKEKTMLISREAAIEAMKRAEWEPTEKNIDCVINGPYFHITRALAEAIQELWDACPEKRPVDNRVIAMRHALDAHAMFHSGERPERILVAFDDKLAELEGGK